MLLSIFMFSCAKCTTNMRRATHIALHEKPYFLFPNVLKTWSFQKKSHWNIFFVLSGKTIFLFPENMILFLDTKRKMIFLKKKKKKYLEIWYFLQLFWKDVLSRKFAPEHDIYFFQKIWYFCFGRKMKEDNFIKKRVEIWYFPYIYVGVTSTTSPLPRQKDKDALVPKKYT